MVEYLKERCSTVKKLAFLTAVILVTVIGVNNYRTKQANYGSYQPLTELEALAARNR